MARSVKRPRAEPEAFHQLGVRGRKTGAVLPDRGVRDEHGMQPLDSIFSPQDPRPDANGDDSEDGGSVAMDIASSAGPGPQTLLRNHRLSMTQIPKSRSPIRTHLNSPAKKNPNLNILSSPSRSGPTDDKDVTVTRKLDFTAKSNRTAKPAPTTTHTAAKKPARGADTSAVQRPQKPQLPSFSDQPDVSMSDMAEQSLQMVDAMSDDFDAGADFGQGQDWPADDENVTGTGGREQGHQIRRPPPKPSPMRSRKSEQPASRKRTSLASVLEDKEAEDESERRPAKAPRTSAPPSLKPSPAKPAIQAAARASVPPPSAPPVRRGPGRPRKSERRPPPRKKEGEEEEEGDESFMEIQRAPPMPRSRGLISLRGDNAMSQTRSYRTSARPVEHWRNERIIRESEEQNDLFDEGEFVVSTIRDVVRMPREAPPSTRAPQSKSRQAATTRVHEAVAEDEELEEWEVEDGSITTEIVLWEPHHEYELPGEDGTVQVTDERVAISADAIQTMDIPDATFRFAKTLTLPFLGSGVVDLPPGAVKRPKNSRKMHMVFFVHYGKVLVSVKDAQFRISAGGTWFVPRSNYYSITNDYEFPARLFFAQGCEFSAQDAEITQTEPLQLLR